MNKAMPRYRFNRLTDITLEDIERIGGKGLCLDVDNTTAYDCSKEFIPGVPQWIEDMKAKGMKMVILSNAVPKRAKWISGALGIPAIGMSLKPMPWGYIKAARMMGIKCSEMVVIGDQLFTDIRGGNIVGAITVFVNPARKETRNVKIFESRRRREKPILEEFDRINGVKANEKG